jgi:heme exporter protein A
VITLQNVTKTYGPVRALIGVTCQFPPRSISFLRGPNGSGKSTLLSILGTVTRPTSGRVDHGELGSDRPTVRSTLGWVAHDSLCYPDLTGRENIRLAAALHGRDPEAAFAEAAVRFDLQAFANRSVRTFSRGQRQRIALARALIHAPLLILLDEPTTGLDAVAIERLRTVLLEEARRGATIVLSTHDDAFATALEASASREGIGGEVVALDRGRRVAG